MLGIVEGQRYSKTGDRHIWVVDAVLRIPDGKSHAVVLVSDDGTASHEAGLVELADRDLYQPLPPATTA